MVDMTDRPHGDQPLGYLLSRVASALRAEVTATVLEPLGLSFSQYICMRMLSHWPGRSNAELARDVGVSPQAMNMVVRGLQERGLVDRPATVASGRSLPAELTREGTALLSRLDAGVHEAELKVLAPLGEADRRQFKRILAALG
ncbi:MarR family winged helix-turn-helix transcriptional regulator [Mycobacterium sp. URHB0044]|jgi:DNA-binding MarR family transcriptional regulator|uniref:MarR family winged helix-turn-helix transcriptional regulator n=1 Tax=Mycobacterium sp. URHB0044 TaxID=1380386 RepID=UPI000A60A093|nr:MarR family transcriptional regulator [Mycobacterium sp. URHB0044]